MTAASTAPTALAAAQRYASPSGSGTACTAASPCGIRQAVEGAGAGDEVIVNPGDYALTDTLDTPSQVTIHGVGGHPRPRLLFSGPAQQGLRVLGSTLRYVEVEQTLGPALTADAASVDRVVVKGLAHGYDTARIQGNSTISNSVLVASGINGRAIVTTANGVLNMATYRNVTAVATGTDGVAVEAGAYGGTGSATIHAVNVIARGGPGGAGLRARTDGSGAYAAVTAIHSNYGTKATVGSNAAITNGGGNQADPPVFVNAAAGDYRQTPASPTVGAGLDNPANGAFDVDGDPRTIGTTDIGADELVPAPSATTGPAGAVTRSSATLGGSVDPKGVATTYRFEYGTTTAYGRTTPATSAGSATAPVSAGASLAGLGAGTTYHYRLVAMNGGGVTAGTDRTFTTAAAPASTTPTPPAVPFAGVKLVSQRLTYARRAIVVGLRCPAGTVGHCSGRVKLTARARRAGSRRVRLGRATFSIAPGGRARIKVRVGRAGRRLLMNARRLRASAVTLARNAADQQTTGVTAVTIRRRHR